MLKALDASGRREDTVLIFGTDDVDGIFEHMNADGGDTIEFGELLAYLETRGLDVTTSLVGFPARPPKNIVDFAMNMIEAVSRDLTRSNQTSDDRPRTIPISTDYIGTTTFNLVDADLQFMIESGRKHTKAFLDAVKGGKGLYVYHWASSAFTSDAPLDKEYERALAGGWRKQGNHGKPHAFMVTVRKEHPVTAGVAEFKHGPDELYQNSVMFPESTVLATAFSDLAVDPKNTGKHEPVVWIANYGKGRVVENVLGHDVAAMQGAPFQKLLVQGVAWAAEGAK